MHVSGPLIIVACVCAHARSWRRWTRGAGTRRTRETTVRETSPARRRMAGGVLAALSAITTPGGPVIAPAAARMFR